LSAEYLLLSQCKYFLGYIKCILNAGIRLLGATSFWRPRQISVQFWLRFVWIFGCNLYFFWSLEWNYS